MKDKKYIIFDLDGTLVDSFPTVVNACKRVFEEYAPKSMPTDDSFDKYHSKDMEEMFIGMADISNLGLDKFRRKDDEQYALDCLSETKIISRQIEILTDAKAEGIGIIVVTNKKQKLVERVCEKLLGNNLIDIVIGRKDANPIIPRHVIKERLYELGILP